MNSNKNKNLGQYFTPDFVADFMIGLSSVPKSAEILEPACGQGVFLDLLQKKGYENITGYEVDKTLKPITTVPIIYKSFVNEKISKKFDLIIGNPPYIRWKNLNTNLKKELLQNKLWQHHFNQLCDYLYLFILKSVELLKKNGELIFITPEYWINTKHAQTLRNYLVLNGYFTDIIHFNETPIFDKVASSIVIFKFIKTSPLALKSKKIKIVKYKSTQKLNPHTLDQINNGSSDNIEQFEINQFLPNQNWLLASHSVQKRLRNFEEKCLISTSTSLFKEQKYFTLSDIAEIGNGMVSGLDKAFQIPDTSQLTKKEKVATISVLKAKNIKQYVFDDLTPYIFLNETLKKEKDLKKNYPTFYSLLNKKREQLEKRYNYNRKIFYWGWVFPRNLKLFEQPTEKIFVPCKERISHKDYFRFTYVPADIFPTQDVTAIIPKPETKESIFYILALLNSKNVFEWLKHKGVVKGNIVEFSRKPLASIPIKRIDWNKRIEVKLHDEITALCKNYIDQPSEKQQLALNKKVEKLFS